MLYNFFCCGIGIHTVVPVYARAYTHTHLLTYTFAARSVRWEGLRAQYGVLL